MASTLNWLSALLDYLERSRSADESGPALQQRLEQMLLGGARRYTRGEVSDASGISAERATKLWRALGFADVGDDEVVFNDADVDALRTLGEFTDSGYLTPELEASVTRAMGQSLSRLAEWQAGMLSELVIGHTGEVSEADVLAAAGKLLPVLERMQSYVWRRHLAAVAGRVLASSVEELISRELTVGFADIVGFTKLSRRLSQTELGELIESFEGTATEVVAEGRGRVVKTLGDEVLFVADSPADAAEIGLRLVERIDPTVGGPALRVGMASGDVVTRFGDVYGPVVNVASRLTSLAKPGTALVDRDLAAALKDHPDYELRARRVRVVRGYAHLRPCRLRRRRPGSSDDPARDIADPLTP